jgi:hypothetical protein
MQYINFDQNFDVDLANVFSNNFTLTKGLIDYSSVWLIDWLIEIYDYFWPFNHMTEPLAGLILITEPTFMSDKNTILLSNWLIQ